MSVKAGNRNAAVCNQALNMDRGAVAKRVRQIRQDRGLSTGAMAAMCEMTGDTILRMESGRIGFHADTLFRVCAATGVSADWILWGECR